MTIGRWRVGQSELLLGLLVGLLLLQSVAGSRVSTWFDAPALQSWSVMFVAIVIQALPFLLFGVVVATVVSRLLTERALRRLVPTSPTLAVPTAGAAAIGLVGCECASVPIASSAIRRGIPPGAALTFLLAAPAVNPVVLVSTAVAFPGQPAMVAARFAASMATAVVVGWLWVWRGGGVPPLPGPGHAHGAEGWRGFVAEVQHDLFQTAGYLVVGAGIAAGVNTFVPRALLEQVAGHAVLAIVVMALFAFVVALCSQTDAFVAASLVSFSLTARLVFLVVGPAMDVKLAVLEAGTFGRRFAVVFVPVVVVTAVACAVLVGWALL